MRLIINTFVIHNRITDKNAFNSIFNDSHLIIFGLDASFDIWSLIFAIIHGY